MWQITLKMLDMMTAFLLFMLILNTTKKYNPIHLKSIDQVHTKAQLFFYHLDNDGHDFNAHFKS